MSALSEELEEEIDTLGGPLFCTDAGGGNVTVEWGEARTNWDQVPLAQPADTNLFELNVDGARHEASAVSMGNPHVVLFVDDADTAPVATGSSNWFSCSWLWC